MSVSLPRGLVVLLGSAATVVVFVGVRAMAWLIGPVFLALIIVIAVAPVQSWLRSKGWPGWASTLVVVLAVYAIVFSLALAIIVSIARLGTELPKYASQGSDLVNSLLAQLAKWGVGPEQIKQAAGSLDIGKLAGLIGGLLGSVAGLATNFVFIIALLLAGSTAPGSRSCRTRRMVDSCGTTTPTPSRSRMVRPVSWAYSAIAANDRAPVRTAHAPSSRIANTPWRIPRGFRGSGTSLNASTSDNAAAGVVCGASVSSG